MPNLRCAIYTRKSSEEGLEQDFNSLDAQREACASFIQSQRHEGWTLITGSYDDGGLSGGTMNRPALQRLSHDPAGAIVNDQHRLHAVGLPRMCGRVCPGADQSLLLTAE